MSTFSDTGTEAVLVDLGRSKVSGVPSWMGGGGAVDALVEYDIVAEPVESLVPLRAWYLPVKSAVEWLLGLSVFVMAAPVIVVLALLVKATSRGPAFYSQTRLGRNGRLYRIYKLRTMMHNCEAATGAVWALKNDPRITAIGKILRDTHLDELPQLLNILQGHMGLIGPRPERPELVPALAREIPHYRQRLQVKPGVTGLAQMLLPADSDLFSVRRKVVHDLHYIRHVSPLMDVRIALCTACYFFAAAAKAGCKLLVGGYGEAIAKKCDLPEPDQDELF
ncbi:MAG TPA: sugar transferase [Tepidisphaeraceae bacterium]|jgi:lipopolysaccharide/colanic/teichoic acid biosynthesis glycosyltransferase